MSTAAAPPIDDIIESIYRAGSGMAPWTEPLNRICQAFDLWVMQFFAIDKSNGAVIFSHEGGNPAPEVALDYFREFHQIDPRAALVATAPPGQWIACDEHFDETYVAQSRFYQDFLIPYGGRYVYGAKIHEDEQSALVASFLRGVGKPQVQGEERTALQRISSHLARAFDLNREVRRTQGAQSLGLAVLDKMRQPLMILDSQRAIAFANETARALLARGEVIAEKDGFAVCRHADSDVDLMMAMRELALERPRGDDSPLQERRGIRLAKPGARQKIAATLLALRPERVMGAFGSRPLALLSIYEPGTRAQADPFLLATTFDLTPAEARVASRVASGMLLKEIARDLKIALPTVRTHLSRALEKTGARNQADLVRVLLLAGDF